MARVGQRLPTLHMTAITDRATGAQPCGSPLRASFEQQKCSSFAVNKTNLRILIIDDNRSIHGSIRKILCPEPPEKAALDEIESAIFDVPVGGPKRPEFEIASAYQGQEGLALVQEALKSNQPYAMAFVDVRMPPGWDGIETTAKIWEVDPDIQIVICTAYADYSWDELFVKLGRSDQFVILKKPFEPVEVLQLAGALTEKWRLHQESKQHVGAYRNEPVDTYRG
jgi:CheY-like chemotaxis protein